MPDCLSAVRHTNAHADSYGDSYRHTHTDGNGHAYRHADGYAKYNSESDTNCDGDTDASSNTEATAYPASSANAVGWFGKFCRWARRKLRCSRLAVSRRSSFVARGSAAAPVVRDRPFHGYIAVHSIFHNPRATRSNTIQNRKT